MLGALDSHKALFWHGWLADALEVRHPESRDVD